MTRNFISCEIDLKCQARNIVYFSFLIPLHHRIVYDFAIGCATGQSRFVAIEKRCNCLIWASIPFNTMLSGYCLFEIIIDRSSGGTFIGCQNVIDQFFRVIKLSNKFSLNRLPYAMQKCSDKQKKIGFVSTLKKLFIVNTFCEIDASDISHLKNLEIDKLKNALTINDMHLPRWAERMYNCKNVKHKCGQIVMEDHYLLEAKRVEVSYAEKTTVENELIRYRSSQISDIGTKNIFIPSPVKVDSDAGNLLHIDVKTDEDFKLENRHSIKSWKQASLISARKSETSSLIPILVTNNVKETIQSPTAQFELIENEENKKESSLFAGQRNSSENEFMNDYEVQKSAVTTGQTHGVEPIAQIGILEMPYTGATANLQNIVSDSEIPKDLLMKENLENVNKDHAKIKEPFHSNNIAKREERNGQPNKSGNREAHEYKRGLTADRDIKKADKDNIKHRDAISDKKLDETKKGKADSGNSKNVEEKKNKKADVNSLRELNEISKVETTANIKDEDQQEIPRQPSVLGLSNINPPSLRNATSPDSDSRIKKSFESMMEIALGLHDIDNCGELSGRRISPKLESRSSSQLSHKNNEDKKLSITKRSDSGSSKKLASNIDNIDDKNIMKKAFSEASYLSPTIKISGNVSPPGSEHKIKTSYESMMDIATSLHDSDQCGMLTGRRITPRLENKEFSSNSPSTKISPTMSMKDTLLSKSDMCSSTTITERLTSPQLVISMENIETRDQLWTPVPFSEQDPPLSTINQSNLSSSQQQYLLEEWERRLSWTMTQCMMKEIF